MLPHPEDVRSVQTRLVRNQRGLVCFPVLATEQVSVYYLLLYFLVLLFITVLPSAFRAGVIVCLIMCSFKMCAISMLAGHRVYFTKTISRMGGKVLFCSSSVGRTGCQASTERDYIKSIDRHLVNNEGIFSVFSSPVKEQQTCLRGKFNTIGNSLNLALPCSDVVLQSKEERFE